MNATRHVKSAFHAIRDQFIVGSGRRTMYVSSRNCATFRAHAIVLALLAMQGGAPALAQCHYVYTPIPRLPGWNSFGTAINNRSEVVGWLDNAGDTVRAFYWSEETGTVMLPLPTGFRDMVAEDINDLGDIVGYVGDTNGIRSGFVYDGHTFTIIPPPAWADALLPSGINNRGQVAGTISNVRGPIHAFRWESGVLGDIGAGVEFPGDSFAKCVGEDRTIVGRAQTVVGGQYHVIAVTDHVGWPQEPESFLRSGANGQSDNGFIVGDGSDTLSGPYFGIIWGFGDPVLIAAPPSPIRQIANVIEINNAGRAVGRLYTDTQTGIVWQNGVVTDLNTLIINPPLPYRIATTVDINESGVILALRSASLSAVLTPVWLPGDLTGDCHVSIEDLVIVLANFGMPIGSFPRGDADLDGQVSLSDLTILLSHWGE